MDEARERQLLRDRLLGWAPACPPLDQPDSPPGAGSSGAGAGDSAAGGSTPSLLTGQHDLGRDLRLTVGPNGRDLARVRGLDNLAQSLAVALTTLLGSDLFNTQFGFDGLNALVEETHPMLMRERVRVAVIQVLRRDPRVRRIVDVQLEDGRLEEAGAAPALGADAGQDERRRRSRELSVRVAFETVSGDQAAVDLGRFMPHV